MDKHTPFYSLHKMHNARLVSFAGYVMPIQYNGVNFEHNHVRNIAGVFDVSHMNQIIVRGHKAFDLVQKVTTNNILKLSDGKVQYSCMLNSSGGIIDDLLVYRFSKHEYMLVVNASNAEKDFNWICSNNNLDVEVLNVTKNRGLLAVQGPKAHLILQDFTDLKLSNVPYYSFVVGKFADCSNVIISNTGYTGSGGFELYFDKQFCVKAWKTLFNNNLLKPIGLAARDTLRLEMGYCLYGNDIDESRSPIEAGLSWIVKMDKNFIGKDFIAKQLLNGVKECLIGFVLQEKGVPRKGYCIIDKKDNIIGSVTSGTMSPLFQKGFGMGYVLKEESYIGNNIFISIRDKKIKGKIIKLPFYEK